MHTRPLLRAPAAFLIAVLAVVAVGSARGGETYRLATGSAFSTGCYPPCLCPIWITDDLRGTFTLTPQVEAGTYARFRIIELNLRAGTGENLRTVVGEGVYEVFSEFAQLQRLRLRASVDGGPIQEFDSGIVLGGGGSALDVTVSINGMVCLDSVLQIIAEPVPGEEIVAYTVADESLFMLGCFPPCECALLTAPLTGRFDVVPLGTHGGIEEYNLTNLRFRALPCFVSIPILGFGTFERDVATDPALERLTAWVRVGLGPRQRLDSGFAPAVAAFPTIAAVASENQMVCYDTVIDLVAAPTRE